MNAKLALTTVCLLIASTPRTAVTQSELTITAIPGIVAAGA